MIGIYRNMMLTLLIVGYLLGAIATGYILYIGGNSFNTIVLGSLIWPAALIWNVAINFIKVPVGV